LNQDDYKVFGSCSYTQTKTIIVCDASVSEASARDILTAASTAYTAAVQNPFQVLPKKEGHLLAYSLTYFFTKTPRIADWTGNSIRALYCANCCTAEQVKGKTYVVKEEDGE